VKEADANEHNKLAMKELIHNPRKDELTDVKTGTSMKPIYEGG